MSILINKNTRVVVQGITGKQGSFHTKEMMNYGTNIVAGVTPGRGGMEVEGIPVFDTVAEAIEKQQADASVIFVPAPLAKEAAFEAIGAGIKVLVIVTEHIPFHDALQIVDYSVKKNVVQIGPNSFGICSAGQAKIGIPPNSIFTPGPVGVVSRSGTLTYEIVSNLSLRGVGQTTCLGLGGDSVVGLSFVDILRLFEKDNETRAVVLIGEIGGRQEEEASIYIKSMTKPVVGYIAGKSAPPGKRMGHAGAIIERGAGGFKSKVESLKQAGVKVAEIPSQVADYVADLLKR
ncbi:MAG: Succinate--CoA ligase (ADP-forming) subunit alpha [candidate division WS2 bacterium]|uniref:Succinate--CoA ligase [ADP-forming] subunit alpha n=1 Tax=Psychracetigena formicireducens TaxID=2986056 RepID=A0A9E2BF10_PSYF1|nr:Succinate--CoA ligase (ADP-forming) subunit alpha [Candidatus Psychracetigena formicireducens]MBT9144408.1 Succinate--CoA ligase (ADP-forming) subunit alpha [Candidatus Psychracetigena formicireducens]MBT9150466.1 Succinate--CoA ligase (ADP-forming) subunit alpha [Candidatus Psychracetigena formicireducens]